MFRKKRVIFALLIIFVCGFVSGAALAPVMVHKMAGNPYSREKLSERVFNANYLNDVGLTENQREIVNGIIAKYVDKYRTARDSFSNSRNFIYSEFNTAVKEVLTPAQYERYRINSDNDIRRRREYHDKMERAVMDEKKVDTEMFVRERDGKRRLKEELDYYDGLLEKKYGGM